MNLARALFSVPREIRTTPGFAAIPEPKTVHRKTGALVADPSRLTEFVKEHAKRKGYTIQRAKR